MKGIIKSRSFASLKKFNVSRLKGKSKGYSNRGRLIIREIISAKESGLFTPLISEALNIQLLSILKEIHKLQFFIYVKENNEVLNLLGYSLPPTKKNIEVEFSRLNDYLINSLSNTDVNLDIKSMKI